MRLLSCHFGKSRSIWMGNLSDLVVTWSPRRSCRRLRAIRAGSKVRSKDHHIYPTIRESDAVEARPIRTVHAFNVGPILDVLFPRTKRLVDCTEGMPRGVLMEWFGTIEGNSRVCLLRGVDCFSGPRMLFRTVLGYAERGQKRKRHEWSPEHHSNIDYLWCHWGHLGACTMP